MLIDFHTHIFPDKIAARTIEVLKQNIVRQRGKQYNNYSDGTLNGLLDSMDRNNVDISVVLPIATKPSQTNTINDFAEKIRSDRIYSFGSLHPDNDDFAQILEDLKRRGFLGIKLHPEYQQFYIDSKRSIDILKKADSLGLYVTLHCGQDIGMEKPVHCSPDRLKNVLEYVSGEKIICGHLGGFWEWDNVEKYLVGTPYLFDTAFLSGFIEPEQYKRIIINHSADKLLFASDSPWEEPKAGYDLIKSLGLSESDEDKIFYKNALKILK